MDGYIHMFLSLLVKSILLFKPAAQTEVGKIKFINCFITPQAPAPRKTEENTIQESNQRLTAPLNPCSIPV